MSKGGEYMLKHKIKPEEQKIIDEINSYIKELDNAVGEEEKELRRKITDGISKHLDYLLNDPDFRKENEEFVKESSYLSPEDLLRPFTI